GQGLVRARARHPGKVTPRANGVALDAHQPVPRLEPGPCRGASRLDHLDDRGQVDIEISGNREPVSRVARRRAWTEVQDDRLRPPCNADAYRILGQNDVFEELAPGPHRPAVDVRNAVSPVQDGE